MSKPSIIRRILCGLGIHGHSESVLAVERRWPEESDRLFVILYCSHCYRNVLVLCDPKKKTEANQ